MTAVMLADDDAGRAEAIRVLRAGGIVALPTDTVYGLAADLGTPGAVEALFEAKRRPADRAIVLLLADGGQATELADWPATAAALAEAFWPGGLTLVVTRRSDVSLPAALTGGRPTIGLRVPDHVCPRAIAAVLGPLPVTSANVSGLPEARGPREIVDQLGGAVDLVLDGGPARGGSPSTIVDCSGPDIRVLRIGTIAAAAIDATLAAAGLASSVGGLAGR